MYLPSFLRKKDKTVTEQPLAADRSAMTAQQFCAHVDFLVELFRLDPSLPELADLKAEAEEIVSSVMPLPLTYLRMLNPQDDIQDRDGVIVLQERMLFGHVLESWSLARHHCRELDEQISKIVADGSGTHLFINDWREREVFVVRGGAINPHRLADTGNRYGIACEIIRQLTGVEIDYLEQVGVTRTITVTKDVAGVWQVEFDRVQALAG